jgi:hypothetical protein
MKLGEKLSAKEGRDLDCLTKDFIEGYGLVNLLESISFLMQDEAEQSEELHHKHVLGSYVWLDKAVDRLRPQD